MNRDDFAHLVNRIGPRLTRLMVRAVGVGLGAGASGYAPGFKAARARGCTSSACSCRPASVRTDNEMVEARGEPAGAAGARQLLATGPNTDLTRTRLVRTEPAVCSARL
jgi:hypothetical protein